MQLQSQPRPIKIITIIAGSPMNSVSHYRNLKQLNTIIDSYEKKLDDQVNDLFNHIINYSRNVNQVFEDKSQLQAGSQGQRPGNTNNRSFQMSNRSRRAQSIGAKSFLGMSSQADPNMQNSEVEGLIENYKTTMRNRSFKPNNETIMPLGRMIGSHSYVKPKIVRRKPEILSKQMRWDPFYQKNAIKAQQLNQGMLSLIAKGRVGKNIDIITAFEKGRPILQTHQAIFHHMEQKFADADYSQSQIKANQTHQSKREVIVSKKSTSNYNMSKNLVQHDDESVQYGNNSGLNSWALTMPQIGASQTSQLDKTSNPISKEDIDEIYVRFTHYQIVRDENFALMRKKIQFIQNWGEVTTLISQIQRALKLYNIQFIYCNANKMLTIAKKGLCLNRLSISDINQILVQKNNSKSSEKGKIFSLKAVVNRQNKKIKAIEIISAAIRCNNIKNKYMKILKRKKYEKKIKQWLLNGLIIKDYRRELSKIRDKTLQKFRQQQAQFRQNFPSIQQSKHYQIHIANRTHVPSFKHFEQYCNTQITRIFNLQNSNTNIIYVSPFQLNVETINYYFKIMQLQQIENYNERVTFLELEDIASRVKLPQFMCSSQKLYYNSKALRKLKRKVQGSQAYFVTNYPTQVDINLSVFLGIPIYCGDFHTINCVRSQLYSDRLLCASIAPPEAFVVPARKYNLFSLSVQLAAYCQSTKKHRKYILKLNNQHNSTGLALLTYPFGSLPELYGCTVCIEPKVFVSSQKYYQELIRYGGVVQLYEEGEKMVTVSIKMGTQQNEHTVLGTFEKLATGFVNVGYLFPQRCVPHGMLMEKCNGVIDRMAELGHVGYMEITLSIAGDEQIRLEEVELYPTKITNSLFYFKFLAGGYFSPSGQFLTKITADEPIEPSVALEPRAYCYIPYLLHFSLSDKQSSSFFQLCRISGISFDLENKYGTTFIILGSMRDTIGLITTAKDRRNVLKLTSKACEFLVKQNSYNVSTEMLKEKEARMKQRFNISGIKDKIEELEK